MIKLNLGCGEDIRVGFTNIDIRNLPNLNLKCDATRLVRFKPNSVDLIVAQHLLEYIPRDRMLPAILEWFRLLKPKGVLEIRVMDLSLVTKALYLNDISKEMGLHHEMVLHLLYGKQSNEYDVRRNGFTSEFLQGLMIGCGFIIINVVKEDYDVIISAQRVK